MQKEVVAEKSLKSKLETKRDHGVYIKYRGL